MGSDNDNSAHVSTADTFLFLRQFVGTIQITPLYPTVYYPADNKSKVLPAGNRYLAGIRFLFPRSEVLHTFFPYLILLQSVI